MERILHYIRLTPEAPEEIPDAKPLVAWPSEGALEFKYGIFTPRIALTNAK